MCTNATMKYTNYGYSIPRNIVIHNTCLCPCESKRRHEWAVGDYVGAPTLICLYADVAWE